MTDGVIVYSVKEVVVEEVGSRRVWFRFRSIDVLCDDTRDLGILGGGGATESFTMHLKVVLVSVSLQSSTQYQLCSYCAGS